MGEYAGEFPRNFISFRCLENEYNEEGARNTEDVKNFPNLPEASELETVLVDETENFPSKSLTVMQVAAVRNPVTKDDMNVVAENVRMATQECLLSTSEGVSRFLERFLHERLDPLSGEGLDKIVEVDVFGMLALLKESNVGHR